MKYKNRFLILVVGFMFMSYFVKSQNLKINELMSSNRDVIFDEDGDSPDWIEIINTGDNAVNTGDYFLSDKSSDIYRWQLPDFSLQQNGVFMVFASGKDRHQTPVFWSTLFDKGDSCKFITPANEPASNWKNTGYDDSEWKTGFTGIGYGDNDDSTLVAKGTISVFIRKKIVVEDLKHIKSIWFHIDYDDAFVAYLNGVEIARSGIGVAGESIAFDRTADHDHEAVIKDGGTPAGFDISRFLTHLNEGENILSVQVHNVSSSSSDFTAIPFFTVGYENKPAKEVHKSRYIDLPLLYPHTNFKLSSSGETVYLVHKEQGVVDSVKFGQISGGYSFGRSIQNIENWGFFAQPTPGEKNIPGMLVDIVKSEVDFSVDKMFLADVHKISLSGNNNGEEIRYTIDGSEPDLSSELYVSPFLFSSNTVIRARIFKAGFVPGKIASRTYIFETPPSLPVISITTDPENLWDNETGIYVPGDNAEEQMPHNGANYWEDWEKPASIEMVDTSGERVFSLNCGIKIFGGWSRTFDQKSLSVFFRNDYGDPVLKGVKLFESKPLTEFKSLVLRNSGNDFFYSKMRDGMMTGLAGMLDVDVAAYRPVVLYLNGEYWGIINLREKINEDFIENNFGVDADKVDILERMGYIVEGDNKSYLELMDYIENSDMADSVVYENVSARIDIDNYIDYQLSEIYFDNRDWPGNNIKFWKPQTDDGKWRWLMYDTDFGFGIYNWAAYKRNTLDFATETNGPTWPNPPWSTLLFRRLLENEKFSQRFINRFADVMNTTFIPGNVTSFIDSLQKAIKPEIGRNFEKWPVSSVDAWNADIEKMMTFAKYRPSYMRNHIKSYFSLPAQHSVRISVLPTVSGEVVLNSIKITKPAWEGIYFENVPVKLTAKAHPGYKFHSWLVNDKELTNRIIELNITEKTNIRVIFEEDKDDDNTIVFNEINYKSPDDSDAGDWVEIYNFGDSDIDITGWIFKDNDDEHEFVMPENTVLKSDDYLVCCKKEKRFKKIHPDVKNFIGEFDFGLSSSGDAVRLFNENGKLIDEVIFGSENPWPEEPNGNGATLELRNYTDDNAEAASWRASTVKNGTPGAENSVVTGAGGFEKYVSVQKLKIYPNPTAGKTYIQIENGEAEPFVVAVYSPDGREVFSAVSQQNIFVWEGSNLLGQKLNPGVYICRVKQGQKIFTAKIILSNK